MFGPQAKKLIVGYLIREIRNPSNMLSNSNLKLPNKNGKFPWVISLEYSKPGINLIKKKINETYEINEKGVVKKSSKSSIKIKSP